MVNFDSTYVFYVQSITKKVEFLGDRALYQMLEHLVQMVKYILNNITVQVSCDQPVAVMHFAPRSLFADICESKTQRLSNGLSKSVSFHG